jgi:hypothetical protein
MTMLLRIFSISLRVTSPRQHQSVHDLCAAGSVPDGCTVRFLFLLFSNVSLGFLPSCRGAAAVAAMEFLGAIQDGAKDVGASSGLADLLAMSVPEGLMRQTYGQRIDDNVRLPRGLPLRRLVSPIDSSPAGVVIFVHIVCLLFISMNAMLFQIQNCYQVKIFACQCGQDSAVHEAS